MLFYNDYFSLILTISLSSNALNTFSSRYINQIRIFKPKSHTLMRIFKVLYETTVSVDKKRYQLRVQSYEFTKN